MKKLFVSPFCLGIFFLLLSSGLQAAQAKYWKNFSTEYDKYMNLKKKLGLEHIVPIEDKLKPEDRESLKKATTGLWEAFENLQKAQEVAVSRTLKDRAKDQMEIIENDAFISIKLSPPIIREKIEALEEENTKLKQEIIKLKTGCTKQSHEKSECETIEEPHKKIACEEKKSCEHIQDKTKRDQCFSAEQDCEYYDDCDNYRKILRETATSKTGK